METSLKEQLLKRIQELEAGQASLRQELCKLILEDTTRSYLGYINQEPQSISVAQWSRLADSRAKGGGSGVQEGTSWKKDSVSSRHPPLLPRESRRYCDTSIPKSGDGSRKIAMDFTERQYLNILESVGQAVYMFDSVGRITYWNRSAEILYGYCLSGALSMNVLELLACDRDKDDARHVIYRGTLGETWSGTVPVKNKLGKRFLVFITNCPFYDDQGNFLGIVGVAVDSQFFLQKKLPFPSLETFPSSRQPNVTSTGSRTETQKRPQVVVSSKIQLMASKITDKVRSKLKTGENTVEHEVPVGDSRLFDHGNSSQNVLSNHTDLAPPSTEASSPGGDIPLVEKVSRETDSEDVGKIEIHKIASRAKSWINNRKRTAWPWKGSELDVLVERTNHQADESDHQKSSDSSAETEFKVMDGNRSGDVASGPWFSTTNSSSTSSGRCIGGQ